METDPGGFTGEIHFRHRGKDYILYDTHHRDTGDVTAGIWSREARCHLPEDGVRYRDAGAALNVAKKRVDAWLERGEGG